MGLGSLATFGLADARAKATECRRLAYDGVDPIEARRNERTKAALEAAKSLTFKEGAEQYLAAHRVGWRNAKHAAQWRTTVSTYADPVIGALPVQKIDTALVMKIVEPLWSKKPETAARPDRGRARLGDGAQLSPGRQPGTVAWPSRQAAASAHQSAQGEAPCRPAL
jgi:hypothetical protein